MNWALQRTTRFAFLQSRQWLWVPRWKAVLRLALQMVLRQTVNRLPRDQAWFPIGESNPELLLKLVLH
jgi:hypothetical protein